MSEEDVQARVTDEARWAGWRVAHFKPARVPSGRWVTPVAYDGAGFPDLVLAHPARGLALVEVKGTGGRPSPAQREWLAVLSAALPDGPRAHVGVVGPGNLEAFCAWLRGEAGDGGGPG